MVHVCYTHIANLIDSLFPSSSLFSSLPSLLPGDYTYECSYDEDGPRLNCEFSCDSTSVTITVCDITITNMGQYTCQGNSTVGGPVNDTATLEVEGVCRWSQNLAHAQISGKVVCEGGGGRNELRGQEYRRWPRGYVPYTLEYIQTWLCSTFCIDDVVQSFTLFQ